MSDALFAKLWWNFRTSTSSLWGTLMWNKYCKNFCPVIANGHGASNVCKKMLFIREVVEHNIWWQIKSGRSSFLFDNWTRLGALYFIDAGNYLEEEVEIREFITDGAWDKQRLGGYLTGPKIVNHICDNIKPPDTKEESDKAWWIGSSLGVFSIKTAWDLVRARSDRKEEEKQLWVKGLPFKINFFSSRRLGKVE